MSNIDYKVFFNGLTINDKILMIKRQSIHLNSLRAKLDKALLAESNFKGSFCGKGKGSTICANSEKISKQYNSQIEMIKLSVSLL